MRAEYVRCDNCGNLIWSPIMYRHQRSYDCRLKAALVALENWHFSHVGTNTDENLQAVTEELLMMKTRALFGPTPEKIAAQNLTALTRGTP